jgi:hypothetical protein
VHPPETAGERLVEYLLRQEIRAPTSEPYHAAIYLNTLLSTRGRDNNERVYAAALALLTSLPMPYTTRPGKTNRVALKIIPTASAVLVHTVHGMNTMFPNPTNAHSEPVSMSITAPVDWDLLGWGRCGGRSCTLESSSPKMGIGHTSHVWWLGPVDSLLGYPSSSPPTRGAEP